MPTRWTPTLYAAIGLALLVFVLVQRVTELNRDLDELREYMVTNSVSTPVVSSFRTKET